jgi:hypothetical protein
MSPAIGGVEAVRRLRSLELLVAVQDLASGEAEPKYEKAKKYPKPVHGLRRAPP